MSKKNHQSAPLLSLKQVAKRLGVTVPYVRMFCTTNKLRSVVVDGYDKVSEQQLAKFLTANPEYAAGTEDRKRARTPIHSELFKKQGQEQADALRLVIEFEGTPEGGDWTWYILNKITGRELGWWCPLDGKYFINGKTGVCEDRRTVLRMASGRTET